MSRADRLKEQADELTPTAEEEKEEAKAKPRRHRWHGEYRDHEDDQLKRGWFCNLCGGTSEYRFESEEPYQEHMADAHDILRPRTKEKEAGRRRDRELRKEVVKERQRKERAEKFSEPYLRPIRDKAHELLQRPDMLMLIKRTLDKIIVGEASTKLLVWLNNVCSKTPNDYVQQTITGPSTVGKSHIVHKTLDFIPRHWWREWGDISPTFLKYVPDQDFCLLVIQERRGGEGSASIIRLSHRDDGGLRIGVTIRDKDTGEHTVLEKDLPPRGVCTTTTDIMFNPEDASRNWMISLDDSYTQTEAIVKYKLNQAELPPKYMRDAKLAEQMAKVVRCALRILEDQDGFDVLVSVPYASKLKPMFQARYLRLRRDVDKLLSIIRIIAILHQKQRPTFEVDGQRYVVALPQDALMAFTICTKQLEETITGVQRRLERVLNAIKEMVLKDIEQITHNTVSSYLMTEKGETTGASSKRVGVFMRELMNLGFLYREKQGTSFHYWLEDSPPIDLETVQRLTDCQKEWIAPTLEYLERHGLPSTFPQEYIDPLTGERENVGGELE